MGILNIAAPLIGAGLGMFTQGSQDKRQLEQQKKLQELQLKGGKEMADYNKENSMDIWNRTNYGAQKAHMKAAGLNPALMYGQGGGGGATTSGGSGGMPSGGSAGDPNAGTANVMGMAMMAANLKLIEAQTNKVNVEAAKEAGVDTEAAKQGIEGSKQQAIESQERVKGIQFDNEMNRLFGWESRRADNQLKEISAEEANLKWEMYKAVAWGSGNVTDEKNIANKALRAEFEKSVTDLQNAKKEGRLKDAQTTVEQFKANLAKEGFAPDSPWYVKTIETLLNKAGIHTKMFTN